MQNETTRHKGKPEERQAGRQARRQAGRQAGRKVQQAGRHGRKASGRRTHHLTHRHTRGETTGDKEDLGHLTQAHMSGRRWETRAEKTLGKADTPSNTKADTLRKHQEPLTVQQYTVWGKTVCFSLNLFTINHQFNNPKLSLLGTQINQASVTSNATSETFNPSTAVNPSRCLRMEGVDVFWDLHGDIHGIGLK